jgi:hypothetical protein
VHFALCNSFFPAVLQTHCKSQRASNKLVLDAGSSGFIMIYLCTWWSWWLFCTLFPCLYDFMLALICFFLHMCNLISALTYQYPSEIPIIYTHRYAYSPLVTPPQYAVSYLTTWGEGRFVELREGDRLLVGAPTRVRGTQLRSLDGPWWVQMFSSISWTG